MQQAKDRANAASERSGKCSKRKIGEKQQAKKRENTNKQKMGKKQIKNNSKKL